MLSNIPLFALSAFASETEIPGAQAAGFAGLIGSPIFFEEFADQVLDVLNGWQVWVSDPQLMPGD